MLIGWRVFGGMAVRGVRGIWVLYHEQVKLRLTGHRPVDVGKTLRWLKCTEGMMPRWDQLGASRVPNARAGKPDLVGKKHAWNSNDSMELGQQQ
jgi:hypothetical protein